MAGMKGLEKLFERKREKGLTNGAGYDRIGKLGYGIGQALRGKGLKKRSKNLLTNRERCGRLEKLTGKLAGS